MRAAAGLGLAVALVAAPAIAAAQTGDARPRVRDAGLVVGYLPPGPHNAITDVEGVLVGQVTLVEGDSIRTGVTAILPHAGDLFLDKVPAAVHVANGFGKLAGVTQIDELGSIETPVVLTNTLAVGRAADALVAWTLARPREVEVGSVNPVVGETNDGWLNAIAVPRVGAADVVAAIEAARPGPVAEGSVGAGTGTRALGFKGGIGTASRRVAVGGSVHTLGVLVQANFGGALEVAGVQVGRELGAAEFLDRWTPPPAGAETGAAFAPGREPDAEGGSIMIVVATDAPLDPDALGRVARRAPYAIGRVGGFSSHGSGDYVVAFSTAPEARIPQPPAGPVETRAGLVGEALNPLFLAVVEATEEAILNALFRATTVRGRRGTAAALPLEPTLDLLAAAGRLVGPR